MSENSLDADPVDNRPLLCDFDADLRAQIPDWSFLSIETASQVAAIIERVRWNEKPRKTRKSKATQETVQGSQLSLFS